MTNIMQMDLVTGVVAGAFGAFLLLHPDFVGTAMPFAVGILLMIGGIVKLQNSIDMKRLHFTHWKAVLVFAVLLFGVGAVLIYNPFEGQASFCSCRNFPYAGRSGQHHLYAHHIAPHEV